MNNEELKGYLLDIEDIIKSDRFESWRKRFVNKNVSHFTFDDENKLVYSDIHREYEDEIERHIMEGMPKSFDMIQFMKQLPDYLEGSGRSDENVGNAVTTLLEVSDFIQFREMMLCTKRKMEEEEGKHNEELLESAKISSNEALDITNNAVNGMMDLCSRLALAQDNEDGWTELLSLPWMKIHKKPVPESERKTKSEIYLRGVWTLNLNFIEACDMMFTFTKRRTTWDPNFVTCNFPFGGSDADDDVITSVPLNFGYLINLAMFGDSKGITLNVRNFRRWDVPTDNSVTYAMVPWDLKNNILDANHKLLSIKTGTIQTHPTIPNTVIMTTLERNSMGGMPNWALHWMMKATAPNMMKGLESRYIANARNKNDVKDITPRGRRRIHDDDDEKDEQKNHK